MSISATLWMNCEQVCECRSVSDFSVASSRCNDLSQQQPTCQLLWFQCYIIPLLTPLTLCLLLSLKHGFPRRHSHDARAHETLCAGVLSSWRSPHSTAQGRRGPHQGRSYYLEDIVIPQPKDDEVLIKVSPIIWRASSFHSPRTTRSSSR